MEKAPQNHRLEIRLLGSLGERLDRWRRDQPGIPNRAEAARRLMEIGLAAEIGDENKGVASSEMSGVKQ